VRLFCTGQDGSDRGGVTSLVGGFGSWARTHSCNPSGSFLRGVQFRSEDETFARDSDDDNRHWDETAGNNLNGACIGGTVLVGDGTHWGMWSSYSLCPANSAICGLRTKVIRPIVV